MFFGHPLVSQYKLRPPRPAPPLDGGTIALLPGSRAGELRYHVPALLAALQILRVARPKLRAVFGAADAAGERTIARAIKRERLEGVTIAQGVAAAIADADAAFVASGTAVLEAILAGVPSIALYIVNPMVVGYGRRMQKKIFKARFITLPNLVLERELVPELLQEDATPEALAATMEALLEDPAQQYEHFAEVRERLGPSDALDDCARFAVALAKAGQS